MIPKILEYDSGRIKVTPQAFAIPEIKSILDKYDMKAEPYLMYVYNMSAPDSPYINIPEEDKIESVVYDIQMTLGEFDWEDPLLNKAIDKFTSLYKTKLVALADELGEELDRFRKALRSTPLTLGGQDSNFRDRLALLEKIDKVSSSYQRVKKQADEDMRPLTKGDHELGEY